MLAKAFDNQTRAWMLLPDQPWAEKIYKPELFGTSDRYTSVFTTNNGTCEARLYLQGQEHLIGIPYSKIPGEGFRQERQAASMFHTATLKVLASISGGFTARPANVQLVIAPAGRFITTADPEPMCPRCEHCSSG